MTRRVCTLFFAVFLPGSWPARQACGGLSTLDARRLMSRSVVEWPRLQVSGKRWAMGLERIATDTYDFEYIRAKGYTYIDKTSILYPLVDDSIGKQFFLSRPRRFGKSLLISTLQKLFEGKRDLFAGLAIDSLPWDWSAAWPVIRLDMSTCSGETVGEVREKVLAVLQSEADHFDVALRGGADPAICLQFLIDDVAATGPDGRLVLLIDEYDKPLTHWVGSKDVLPFQFFLKSFYSVVKATESKQRFCLMTGVSKFSKVSIFSDLNNLTDITMDQRFSTLLGYTHEEVRAYFPGRIGALAETLGTDADAAFARLVSMYDGYCFDRSMTRVFNPVSLGRCLDTLELGSYWFETGTPGWLMPYAKKKPIDFDNLQVSSADLGTFEPAEPSMPAVLLQTGYLTIREVWGQGLSTLYTLGFPNEEVAAGFNRWLANAYVEPEADVSQTSGWAASCMRAVASGNPTGFMESLESFFSAIGYDLDDRLSEQAYQCVVVAILRFIGIYLDAEVTTSRGRIDLVMRASRHVFVIEMKVASGDEAGKAAARRALAQIRERGYAEPYRCSGDNVFLLGIAFDCLTHNVGAWVSERL